MENLGQTWALVTGASGELGRAIAVRLAAMGIPLYLHYHQGEERVREVERACRAMGTYAYSVQADLRNPLEATKMVEQLPVPPLLLVNNASVDHYGLFTDTTPELYHHLMDANVGSAVFVTRTALPAMIRAQYGRIVNVSSIWGISGGACEVLYSATKAALVGFTKALAKEVASSGITVNAVAPGAISGGMTARFSQEELAQLAEEIPAGRLGSPEEVAGVVAFLLGPDASYLNGQVISPNGGWVT